MSKTSLFLSLLFAFSFSLPAQAEIALGLDGHGGGYVEILDRALQPQSWAQVDWPGYNQAHGTTRPAWCDLDGDGAPELLIGLGQGGGGWMRLLDDGAHAHAALAWIQVPWAAYNENSGETFPACGDIDQDGRDELVIGLGTGSRGFVAVLDDAEQGYRLLTWLQVAWPAYNENNGTVYPAVGDLDGDGDGDGDAAAEIVLGLGTGGGGYLQLLDDATQQFAVLRWIRGSWSHYNSTQGATRPALCNVDDDDANELVLGMAAGGAGFLEVLDDLASGAANLGWPRLSWPSYNADNGTTYPTCGDTDGDGRDELIVGLGHGGGGFYEWLDDQSANFASLGWKRGSWSGYNRASGHLSPAMQKTAVPLPFDAPTVTVRDGEVTVGGSVAVEGLMTVTHADNVASYELWDSTGGGYFRFDGSEQRAGEALSFTAAEIGAVTYVAGAQAGAETLWVRYRDTQGQQSGWLAFQLRTEEGQTAIHFHIAGAASLQALEDVVVAASSERSRQGRAAHGTLFTYQRASHATRHQVTSRATWRTGTRDAITAGTNLLAVDEDGHARLAVTAVDDVRVLFMVTDPAGEYLYLALDPLQSAAVVAISHCAIYRIRLADDTASCLLEGHYLQDMDNAFVRRLGGNQKPLQLDADGNVYFAANPFTVAGASVDPGSWRPIIYRYDVDDGSIRPLTHNALVIRFFLVLETGEVVYQGANALSGQEKLWLYQEGSSIDLTDTPPSLFMRDSYKNLFWVGEDVAQRPGLWFSRSAEGGGVYRAMLKSRAYPNYSASPDQVAVGDNGRLYGVFATQGSGVMIQQMLPYAAQPVVEFDYPGGGVAL